MPMPLSSGMKAEHPCKTSLSQGGAMRKSVLVGLLLTGVIAIALVGGLVVYSINDEDDDEITAMYGRLQQLEDREAIRQLLMDYGRFLDQRDFESFSNLFAQKDGEWNGGMGVAKGPRAIRRLMEETIGKNTGKIAAPNFHIFTNETIQLNGDGAQATTKWIFVTQGAGGQPQPMYLGHYEDSMVRESGRWKFLRRVVHADIPSDAALSNK